MLLFRSVPIAFFTLALATPAICQDRSDAFMASLAHIPATIIEGEESWQLEFGDVRAPLPLALIRVANGRSDLPPVTEAFIRALPSSLQRWDFGNLDGELEAAIGIAPEDLETFVNVSSPPISVDVMTLREGAGARMEQSFLASGLSAQTRDGRQFLWRGEDDFAIHIGPREGANPFAARLPLSMRLHVAGDIVMHAAAWPLTEAMASEDGTTSLAQDPVLQAMARALDHPDTGEGTLANAFVLREDDGSTVLVADIYNGVQLSGLLVFTTPDKPAADALAATLARNWSEAISPAYSRPYADLIAAAPTVYVVEGTPYAIVMRFEITADLERSATLNPIRNLLLQLLMQREIPALLTP